MNRYQGIPFFATTLLFALLLMTGCTIGNSGVAIDIQDGRLTASVSIGEEAINKLIDRAGDEVKVHDDDFLEELYGVNFIEPQTIQIDGLFRLPDGDTTAGTIDFLVTATAGAIRVAVTSVDADGLSLDSPAIRELNDELAEEFAKDIRSQREDDAGITAVMVTDEAFQVTLSTPLSK